MGRGIVTAALFLFKMLLKRLSELSRYTKWIFLFGLFLFAISYFMKDGLPGQNEIDSRLLLKPIQKETAKEPFGVGEVVSETARLLEKTVYKGIAIESRKPAGALIVYGDRSLIAQAIMNVCLNAVAAMTGTGTSSRVMLIFSW